MHMKPVTLLYLLIFLSALPLNGALASQAVSREEARAALAAKVLDLKKSDSAGKNKQGFWKKVRAHRQLWKKAAPIDFSDPVERWLWFGVIGLGAALLLSIIAWSPLVGLLWTAGVICLVVWLIMRFAAV